MPVLGIESATQAISVAISDRGVVLGQNLEHEPPHRSAGLVHHIGELIAECGLTGGELSGIAVSIGPGSYTGLRVGLSVAKSLSFCWQLPLAAVNSLDALAQQGRDQGRLICPMIRFRKNEYYFAYYRWTGAEMEKQSDYRTGTLAEACADLHEPAVLIGPGEEAEATGNHILSEAVAEAKWVAMMGEKQLDQGLKEDLNRITPFYMHEFPITQKTG